MSRRNHILNRDVSAGLAVEETALGDEVEVEYTYCQRCEGTGCEECPRFNPYTGRLDRDEDDHTPCDICGGTGLERWVIP